MRYAAILSKDGRATLAEFPDCPGCQTEAEAGESIEDQALDALTGWLEAHLLGGDVPPRPRARPKGRVLWVDIPASLAVKLGLRWARTGAGLTQAELAKRARVTQQAIAKLEHPDANPSIATLEKVARALGVRLEIDFRPMQAA
ncbi:MAG: type II toxin-antitoxin system HicB family antitoxin [Myxococcaceae bacterium]|nr:type II toxin-antitoxin system HicB family antitoxin [Myxococcaceae bacterium]